MSGDFKSIRRAVRDQIDDLYRWLEVAQRAKKNEAYDAEMVTFRAGEAATALRDSVQKLSALEHDGLVEADAKSIRELLDELCVLGVGKDAPSGQLAPQTRLAQIPSQISIKLKQFAERQRDWDAVDRAVSAGVFLEYVRNNPGKGCLKTFPGFDDNVKYDSYAGYKESWDECEIVVYRSDLWVICTTPDHFEAQCAGDTEYELIDPAFAAAKLLKLAEGLDVEEIIWLKKLAGAQTEVDPKGNSKIVWNRDLGELHVDGELAKSITHLKRATTIIPVLDEFQKQGWPVKIDSPFKNDEDGHTKRSEAIRGLNTNLKFIQFEAVGPGECIRYRVNPDPKSTADQPDDLSF